MDLKEKNELLTNEQLTVEESNYSTSSKTDQIVLSNDLDLLERLHEKHSVGIYTRCKALFMNENIAKEAIPYILLEGYLHLSKTDVPDQEQFFNQLTYHLCLAIAHKAIANKNTQIFSAPSYSCDHPIQELFNKEILSLQPTQLRSVLNKISIGDKALLLMKYQDDMSIEEIAEIVDTDLEDAKLKLVNAQYITIEVKSNLSFQEYI